MSKLSKVFIVGTIVALALAAFALVGCGSGESGTTTPSAPESNLTTIEPGVITVGSDCDYPPFIELENGQAKGFEYDLIQAIGAELGVQVKYLAPQNFDSILASVDAGTTMDIGLSSFTITPEREELISFSQPYIDSNQAIVALKSKGYKSAKDLDGKVVGAQSGTTGADWAKEHIEGAKKTLKEYNQTSEALAAMQAGKIEAVVFDQPVAVWQVEKTYTDAEIVEAIPTGEQYGIAVSKKNPELKDAINNALSTLFQNGTYNEIFAKYFKDLEPTLSGSANASEAPASATEGATSAG